MKVFLIKASIFSAIVLSIFFVISYISRPVVDPEKDYLGAMIDKHERLQRPDSNRLLLVGGSNLSFGIDSEEIQEHTGFNVTNVGLHAGLGTRFILNEIIPEVRSGDVILLSFEYHLFDSGYKADPGTVQLAQWIFP